MPSDDQLRGRYERIGAQLIELYAKYEIPLDAEARLATAVALLHHKMPHYFWTGYYRLLGEDLVVGPYQGPLACAVLARGKGVCWAAVQRGESVLVPDVHAFPGHIACDARSASEVVVPVRDAAGRITGVIDVDSSEKDAFGAVDVAGLEAIAARIHND